MDKHEILTTLNLSQIDEPLEKIQSQSSDNFLNLIRKICYQKQFDVLKYILSISDHVPIGSIDERGYNILHFVIAHLDEMGGIPFLQLLLSKKDINKIIDEKSEVDGITPAILACTLKRYDVIEMLINANANIRIPSRDGTYIVTETETEQSQQQPQQKIQLQEQSKPITQSVLDFLSRFVNSPNVKKQIPESEQILSSLALTDVKESQNKPEIIELKKEDDTETFISRIMREKINPEPTKEKIITNIGGSRSTIVGQRILNKFPEYSSMSGGNSEDIDENIKINKKKSEIRGSFELGRITNDIHDRVINTIKSIMGVDEQTAKIYKSVLYYRVKEEHPDYSGYERAVEMEKLATKPILKKIDIDKEKDRYEKILSEKSDKKPKKKTSKKKGKKSNIDETSDKKPKKKSKSKKISSDLSESTEDYLSY